MLSPRAKTHNYLNMIMAEKPIKALNPDAWPILLDENGNLAEGLGSNIFIVREGEKSNNYGDFGRLWRFWRRAFGSLRRVRNHESQVLASVAIGALRSKREKLENGCDRRSCGTRAALADRTERRR